MLLKIAIFFLAAICLISLLGQTRWFKSTRKPPKRLGQPKRCPDCGTFLIGRERCPCKDKA